MATPTPRPPECRCPKCGWADRWEDAEVVVERNQYGEAFGSPAFKSEYFYYCPVCGEEVQEAHDSDAADGG